MRTTKSLGAMLAAAALATVAVSTAAAGPGGGNPHGAPPGQAGTPPGQAGATPPGQAKKAANARGAAAAAKAKQAQQARKAAKPTAKVAARPKPPQAVRSGHSSPPGKTTICHRTGSATNAWVLITVSNASLDAHRRHGDVIPATSCPPGGGSQAQSNGQDKVTICHRTSSATNPYVVITIARAGWENGHSKHEGDRILQPGDDPELLCRPQAASAAGAGGTQPSASCPTSTETRQVLGVWHKTGSSKNPYVFIRPNAKSAHYDASKHSDDIVVYGPSTAQTASGNCAQAVGGAAGPPAETRGGAQQRGVAGVKTSRAGGKKPTRGVLGVTASRGKQALRGRLPFTGVPLWAVLLGGMALISTGLALRRTRVRALH